MNCNFFECKDSRTNEICECEESGRSMKNKKTILSTLKGAVKGGNLPLVKSAFAALLSDGEIGDVKEASPLILSPASPSVHTLFYSMLEEYALKNNYYSLCPLLSALASSVGNHVLSSFWEELYEKFFGSRKNRAAEKTEGIFYRDECVYSYSFEGKEYHTEVFSFSPEIGKNMTALKTRHGVLLFDCGAEALRDGAGEISKEEFSSFMKRASFKEKDVVAVFISHAHLDHYGSVSTLLSSGISENIIYADPLTWKIVREQTPEAPFFNVHACYYHPKIRGEPFYNGHILGSCGYVVSFDNVNVVYSGDFCLHSQKTVQGLKAKDILRLGSISRHGVSLLVCESTYGNEENSLSYEDYKYLFSYFEKRYRSFRYRKLYPAFAVGRSQEVALLLDPSSKVLVDGASVGISKLYERALKRRIAGGNVRFCDRGYAYDCVVASSGMLARDSASCRHALRMMNEKEDAAMILTGYMAKEGYGYEVMTDWIKAGKSLLFLPLSAHADRRELLELISALAPKTVLTIHGKGISGADYRNGGLSKGKASKESGFFLDAEEISLVNTLRFLTAITRVNRMKREENPLLIEKENCLCSLLSERGEEELSRLIKGNAVFLDDLAANGFSVEKRVVFPQTQRILPC